MIQRNHRKISIHALREEGDRIRPRPRPRKIYFYPRPPRGGRLFQMSINIGGDLFLSTPSARRATGRHCPMWTLLRVFLSTPSARRATFNKIHKTKMKYISIHALREEGDLLDQFLDSIHISISIHALREEGDDGYEEQTDYDKIFLSTPSARRATLPLPPRCRTWKNFYPRPPRGGRPLSRLPCRTLHVISIHALREEGDISMRCKSRLSSKFLSTPSARRATTRRPLLQKRGSISIHALREEGDD